MRELYNLWEKGKSADFAFPEQGLNDFAVEFEGVSFGAPSACEEVDSDYGYESGYEPHSIEDQIESLSWLFPSINFPGKCVIEQSLPASAEGWFIIVLWQSIAETYGEALTSVLHVLKDKFEGLGHGFNDWRDYNLEDRCFSQSKRTARGLEILSSQQGNSSAIIAPAQFGLYHRGRSVHRARQVFAPNEFGLDLVSVLSMLLTHPRRLQRHKDLWISCAGNECANDNFWRVPCLNSFVSDEVGLVMATPTEANPRYGSPSAFLPL